MFHQRHIEVEVPSRACLLAEVVVMMKMLAGRMFFWRRVR